MSCKLKNLKGGNFRNSNKKDRLAFLARFLKERGCWNFFRERFLNSGYYSQMGKYKDLYENNNLQNGIKWFNEMLDVRFASLFSSRFACCFEFDDIPFDDNGNIMLVRGIGKTQYCERLSIHFSELLTNSAEIRKLFRKEF